MAGFISNCFDFFVNTNHDLCNFRRFFISFNSNPIDYRVFIPVVENACADATWVLRRIEVVFRDVPVEVLLAFNSAAFLDLVSWITITV